MPRARSRSVSRASRVSSWISPSIAFTSGRVAFHERLGQPLLHGERDQLLLRAVVDVALERLRPRVLRGDDPAPGLAELLDQADVPQHEPGLRGHVLGQAFAIGSERIARRRHHADRAEQLAAVPHRERALALGERRQLVTGRAGSTRNLAVRRPRGRRPELAAQREPHPRMARADPLGQHLHQPRQDVLDRVRLACPLREHRQHLVRGRPLAVHDPVRHPARRLRGPAGTPPPRRPRPTPTEADSGGCRRACPPRRPARRRPIVMKARQDREHHRLADHDVDVVEPILQHRDRDRGVQEESVDTAFGRPRATSGSNRPTGTPART